MSVIVHLNPGKSKGTYVPKCTSTEMKRRFEQEKDSSLCDSSTFTSHDMEQSDVLVFYQDVMHYGPENPSLPSLDSTDISTWRWVLFAMYSPVKGANQDEQQQLLSCKEDH